MVGNLETDAAAVDEVLPDGVAPFSLTLTQNNKLNLSTQK